MFGFGNLISPKSKMLVFLFLLCRLHSTFPRSFQGTVVASTPTSLLHSTTTQPLYHAENSTHSLLSEVATTNGSSPAVEFREINSTLTTLSDTSNTLTTTAHPAKSTTSSCLVGRGAAVGGSVFLTISSLAETSGSGSITERRLQLNWHGFTGDPGKDTVAVFDRDPTVPGPSVPLDQARVVEHPSGYFTTYVQFPRINFTPSNLSSECLGYWAAYLRGGVQVLSVSCFRARPFWMHETRDEIGDLSLTNLMIPGTHDSGSYKPYLGKKSDNVLIRYVYAQEENVFNQLAYGIRYLDLRIGFYNKTKEKFWINHSYFKTSNPLATVVADIKSFLDSTSEVVVLDFHRFPVGFDRNPTAHKMLIEYLLGELGDYLIPYEYDYSIKLKNMFDTKKRLLAAYNSKQRKGNPLLWPGIRQYWGDKQNGDQLLTYFESTFQNDLPTVLWSAMAELTPTSSDILRQPKRGLRVLADEVNWKLTMWFRDIWSDLANVVATDFFLGNNMIEVAINTNRRKSCLAAMNATAG